MTQRNQELRRACACRFVSARGGGEKHADQPSSSAPDAPTLGWPPTVELTKYPAAPVATYRKKYRADPYNSSTIGPISISTHMLNPMCSNPPWRYIAVMRRQGCAMI